MPRQRGRKSRSTPRSKHLAALSAARNPSEMPEAEEHPSQSPPRSRSPSPSASQPRDEQPEQQPESKEVPDVPLQGIPALPSPPRDAKEEELQGPAVSPSRLPASGQDTRAPPNLSTTHRRPPGKRVKPLSDKQRAAIQEKLDLLEKNLRPISFAPGKAIDFARHEELFRALGLWDFAHVDLGGPIRVDLLTQLIANYDPSQRRSWVNGVRVAVSRPDLARALGLQWKKDKASLAENKDAEHDLFSVEESIVVVTDFMSNWVLFHEEDACILPGEVAGATQLVREGQPQKVDWSYIMWMMVEKELLEAPTSGFCYYASHMQRLIRHQKPGIFEGEQQDVMEVALAEEEDVNAVEVMNAECLQDSELLDTEKQDTGLCLALGGAEDMLKDNIGECQENEQDQWFPGMKSVDGEHYLRRCNLNDVQSMDSEDVAREEVGMGDEGCYDDDIATKFSNLERMTSTDLLQAMDTVNVPYCLPLQPMEPSSEEFLVSRADPLKSVELDTCMGGSSLFKTASKREIDEIDDDDDGDGISRFSSVNHQKRMRTEGHWDHMSLTIEKCMDEAQALMGKAKVLSSQREQEVASVQMHIQYINSLLQQKEQEIQFLEKTRMEEQHKRQMEICHFEHELGVMARIVQGYRKALMETRRAFAEYRKQFPQGDEQLYKDDDDGGGLVLSMKELERKRLQKEDTRRLVLHVLDEFERKWLGKFNSYEEQVHQLEKRLLDLMGVYDLLKERLAKSRVSAEKE